MSSSKVEALRKLEEAKNLWLEKLAYLEKELVIEDSAGKKFSLGKDIQDCKQVIKDLEAIISQSKRVDRFPLSVEKSEPMTGLEKSIVLIASQNPENEQFGTGFVIKKDEMTTYLLTSAQVVREVGGINQIMVDIYPATVIAQSQENYADDLAVLQAKVLLDAPILPLGKCGETGSIFAAFGCLRNNSYKVKQINGYLSNSVTFKKDRYQAWWTEAWELKIEDDSSLKPGFCGSPVIDSRTRTVTGIVTDGEKDQLDLAISVTNLQKVWAEMPPTLLREKKDLHDLQEIGDLLKSTFDDKRKFSQFCLEYFPSGFDPAIPYFWQIDHLIDYCHQNNELDFLLRKVEQLNPKHLSVFWKYLSYFNVFRKKIIKRIEEPRCQAEITIEIDSSQFTPERVRAFRYALARASGIPWSDIKVLEVKLGSVIVKVELPSKTLDRLIDLYQHDIVTRRNLGISHVTETFEEWFYFKNIQALLEQGFTREELAAICYENFRHFSEQLPPERGKAEIIDRLIEYVRQESRIPELLTLASKRNHEAYNKLGPYYKVPRRPSREVRQQAVISGLTWWERVKAGVLGTVTATIGVLVLFVAYIITPEWLDRSGILASLIWLGLIPLGDIVGRVVSINLNHRRGEAIGRLAAISYLIGYIVGHISIVFLVQLILALADPSMELHIVNILFLMIGTLLEVLSDFRRWMGAGGAYFAYKRAR
ncbi:MAG: serine protease [Leptolyngbyaceae cyanobacterium MO_188.B28]|nr:serine protease [Leptolyngbyaceae cyanobacterium MO_188.B28]